MKLSAEFDSEENVFLNKASIKLFNGLAKLKASCQASLNGDWKYPLLGFFTEHLSVDYDVEEKNALVTVNSIVAKGVHLAYSHDVKANERILKARFRSSGNRFGADVSLDNRGNQEFPSSLAHLAFEIPDGELHYEPGSKSSSAGEEEEGVVGGGGWSGFVGTRVKTNGMAYVTFSEPDRTVDLRYTFKDENLTITPAISLPTRHLQLSFKRRFDEKQKLSLVYDFQDITASAVYKLTPNPNVKLKMGYDSGAGLAWGSIWLGSESDGAKSAPHKTKVQVMLQVPQDDPQNAVILFKIKKRVDLL